VPGGRFERPSWIAFYKQPVPGRGFYQPLAIERVTATDWREQPLNLVPPKVEPNELAKKLYLAVWMEQVRALPSRPASGRPSPADAMPRGCPLTCCNAPKTPCNRSRTLYTSLMLQCSISTRKSH
jgi:hypothetical protein